MKCTVRTRNSLGVTRVLSSSLLKDQRSYGESGQCECIKHSCPDSQREGLSGCGCGGSAACLLTDPCGSCYSCWRHVISGMQCENRAWGTWAWLPCSRATAVRWKPISRPRWEPSGTLPCVNEAPTEISCGRNTCALPKYTSITKWGDPCAKTAQNGVEIYVEYLRVL